MEIKTGRDINSQIGNDSKLVVDNRVQAKKSWQDNLWLYATVAVATGLIILLIAKWWRL